MGLREDDKSDAKSILFRVRKFYPPDKDAILLLIKKRIKYETLLLIANADYGEDRDLHLAKIKSILAQGHLTGKLEWHPLEVLELTKWSRIRFDKWNNLGFEQAHLARLLSCTILLVAEEMPENSGYGYGDSDTLIQWIDSSVKLGGDIISPSMRFLLWKIETTKEVEDRHFLLFGLLILLVEFGNIKMVEPGQLIQLLEDHERAFRSSLSASDQSSHFLFVLDKGQRYDKWIEYAERARDTLKDPWFDMLVETMKNG